VPLSPLAHSCTRPRLLLQNTLSLHHKHQSPPHSKVSTASTQISYLLDVTPEHVSPYPPPPLVSSSNTPLSAQCTSPTLSRIPQSHLSYQTPHLLTPTNKKTIYKKKDKRALGGELKTQRLVESRSEITSTNNYLTGLTTHQFSEIEGETVPRTYQPLNPR
jgi:hypothetical protein